MDIAVTATICTTVIATSAGVVTIIITIKQMKSENSKVLKDIARGQQEGFKEQAKILDCIEKGQEKGFETLEKSFEIQSKILERIEGNTRT